MYSKKRNRVIPKTGYNDLEGYTPCIFRVENQVGSRKQPRTEAGNEAIEDEESAMRHLNKGLI